MTQPVLSADADGKRRLIIASYRLPFEVQKSDGKNTLVQNSGGLVQAMLSVSRSKSEDNKHGGKIHWIGVSESSRKSFQELENENTEFENHPVKLDAQMIENYYGGFCNDTLWPLFHYFPAFAVYKQEYYTAYREANEIFAEKIFEVLKPGDTLWIHDYQLFLLPALIRRRFQNLPIGFFLHIPFPSFEIFRLLRRNWRNEILEGLLGADLVGFHTFEFAQHFMKTVRRTLGYETKLRKIIVGDRIVQADIFPIGIDYSRFETASKSPAVSAKADVLKSQLGGRKLIFSVDRLDYTKGLNFRLLGYERFLELNPQWHNRVVYNMVVVPSRDNIVRYRKMKKEIEAEVGRINGRFSSIEWRPIVYQYHSLTFEEMISLYSVSHAGLITPVRDGMNLVAKEYIATQHHNMGVLILSELAGASAELGDAIIINPTDPDETADAILRALEMPAAEAQEKNRRMRQRIKNYDVFAWARDFLGQIDENRSLSNKMKIRYLTAENEGGICAKFSEAEQKLILLDYDGTLVPFQIRPENAVPPKILLEKLKTLAVLPGVRLAVISGRNASFLQNAFETLPIEIVAEHGGIWRNKEGKWIRRLETNFEWKTEIKKTFEKYASRCRGSFIEEKEFSLSWHYRGVDQDFAEMRGQELKDELEVFLLHHTDISLIEGSRVIEIKPASYNKGSAAKDIFLNENIVKPGFILAMGDDHTDEDLFDALPDDAFTIKVGPTASVARYNLLSQADVLKLLDRLLPPET